MTPYPPPNHPDDSTRSATPADLPTADLPPTDLAKDGAILPECEAIQESLVALLYDDGERAEQSRARDHLARCVPCRLEYADLKGVRTQLGGWTLSSPTAAPVVPARPRISSAWLPAALAAAAGLVLGVGLSMAGRSTFAPASSTPQTVAESRPSAPSGSAEGARPNYVSHTELQQLLQRQESRYQAELSRLRQSLVEASASAQNTSTASDVSSAAVERLVRQSEARQAQLIEARLQSLKTEADLQRQYDMAQIAAGLAYIDSRTGADAARTSELMKNLVRVTAKPQDR